MKPPAPGPVSGLSATQETSAAATAASTAFPPASSDARARLCGERMSAGNCPSHAERVDPHRSARCGSMGGRSYLWSRCARGRALTPCSRSSLERGSSEPAGELVPQERRRFQLVVRRGERAHEAAVGTAHATDAGDDDRDPDLAGETLVDGGAEDDLRVVRRGLPDRPRPPRSPRAVRGRRRRRSRAGCRGR